MQDFPVGIAVTVDELREALAVLCPQQGIDAAGVVALPCSLPLGDWFLQWLKSGRHGDLAYMLRDPQGRLQPEVRNPGARSLLVFAQGYTRGWPEGDRDPSGGGAQADRPAWPARVARYARGRDYHEVFLTSIQGLLRGLGERWPSLRAHACCDTGPYLEREYAWLAGLGFLGKNTCLIHEKLGSGLFLGVAVTNLKVVEQAKGGQAQPEPLYAVVPRRLRAPAQAYLTACGRCTRCIDACPTGAIGPQGGLDAGACIATWTIERRGEVPQDRLAQVGGLLFGCDICQAVCPWNLRASTRMLPPVLTEYATLPEHGEVDLTDLASMQEEEFRRRFRHTPLWRCHPEGLRRNAERVQADEEQP